MPVSGASLNMLRRKLSWATPVVLGGLWVLTGGWMAHAGDRQTTNDERRKDELGTANCGKTERNSSLDWREVVSREGAFRLSFPSEPKVGTKDLETAAGKLVSTSYILEEGPISFFASWLEFPPGYTRSTGEVDILNGAKEAFFKRFKGKFDKERIIRLGAAPGRDVTFRTEDDVRFRLRIFLRGRKLVQTMVMSEPEYIDSADANRFLDSLKWD